MPPNLEAMLRSAIEYAKANRKAEARRLLEQIVSVDQMNEQAWLWLSACVDTAEEQTICLENVLEINPNNQKAIRGLQALQARSAPSPDDPFAGSPFSSSQAAPTPTSVEWGRGSGSTSGHGSGGSVPAFSDEDYDTWLANLPLGTSNSVFTATPSPTPSAPFSLPPDSLADDLDTFDFGSVYSSTPSAEARSADFSGYADESLFAESADTALGDILGDAEEPLEDQLIDLSLYEPPERLDESPFEQGEDAPLTPEDILKAAEAPAPVLPPVPRPRLAPPSLLGGKKRVQPSVEPRHADPSDPFSLIPEEIKAGLALDLKRLKQLPLGVMVLAGLNAVAAIVLIINLFS